MGENEHQYPKSFVKTISESGSEDTHYSLFYDSVPEEYKLYAERKLNETEENKQKGLRKLKAFMKKENLTCNDSDLIYVLRSCKYNMRKCESKLRKFVKFRHNIVQKIAQHDDKKTEIILDDMMVGVLPYRDKCGRTIMFTRPNLRFDLYSMDDIEPHAFALVLYFLSFPMSSICGISYIGEAKAESIYILYPILKGYRPFITSLIDFPLRVGRVDAVNENFLIRLFYNAIRPILPEKITKRVFFNGSGYENLKKYYHPDILPENFGGNLGPLSDRFYREQLVTFMQKLKAEGRILENA